MLIVFRADASTAIGAGHVTRCLTLAAEARASGVRSVFVWREMTADLEERIVADGFAHTRIGAVPSDEAADARESIEAIRALRTPVDAVIVDHYRLGAVWEQTVALQAQRMVVIDDLGDRIHFCELLIDQSLAADRDKYAGKISERCEVLFGPHYALLRTGFAERHGDGGAARAPVHIFFGGYDPEGHSERYGRLLLDRFADLSVRIASRDTAIARAGEAALRAHGARVDWTYDVRDMAGHMASCSVAVGAPGMATWERACIGLPAAYLSVAANQEPLLARFAELGLCAHLGRAGGISDAKFLSGVERFLADADGRARMRGVGMDLVDGRGAARVVERLIRR